MRKLIILLFAVTTIGVANEYSISNSDDVLKNINIGVGISINNPLLRIESRFDINDSNELGFGVGYEGFTQNIYEIEIPEIKESINELLPIVKDILKSSVLGKYRNDGNATLQNLGKTIMTILGNKDPEAYKRVVKHIYESVKKAPKGGTFKATLLATGFQQATVGRIILNNYENKNIKPMDNEELKDYIESKPTLSDLINKVAITVRKPLDKILLKKIDNLTYDDLINSFRSFTNKVLNQDKSLNQDKNIPLFTETQLNENFKEIFKKITIWNLKEYGLDSYKYVFDKYFNYDINDKSKREIVFNGLHDYLGTLIHEKISPNIYIAPFDNDILGRINDANIKNRFGFDYVIKTDGSNNGTNNVFYLSEISLGGVNKKLKDLNNNFSSSKTLSGLWNKLVFNMKTIKSNNITGYFYAKQKLMSGHEFRAYFREELGLMGHINNPYAKLSVFTGLGMGVDYNNKFAFGIKGSLYIPVISEYNTNDTFMKQIFRLPQFYNVSLNATLTL